MSQDFQVAEVIKGKMRENRLIEWLKLTLNGLAKVRESKLKRKTVSKDNSPLDIVLGVEFTMTFMRNFWSKTQKSFPSFPGRMSNKFDSRNCVAIAGRTRDSEREREKGSRAVNLRDH